MSEHMEAVRRQILRRVRYATNTLALLETRLPPEGPFDAALTNGLLVIVSTEWPGEELDPRRPGFLVSARALLKTIQDKHLHRFSFVSFDVLRDGLNLTQDFRHGKAHDEFVTIGPRHYTALTELDQYPGLRLLKQARGLSVDDAVLLAYHEYADEFLPCDPKDRLNEPEPEMCPDCTRPTFLPRGWDDFGGTNTPGQCVACGYERSAHEAWDLAVTEEIQRHMDD